MLTIFPELLVYGFFAPTIIRLAVAAALAYVAYKQYARRSEIGRLRFPIVGQGEWIPIAMALFHAVLALLFFFGYYLQLACLIAIIGFIKGLWLNQRYPHVRILSTVTVLLLLAMCLSLLLSGAGALAQDLPL